MEVLRRTTSIAMISTTGDVLILISTVLSTRLAGPKSEIISENIFPCGLFYST
jgi:hypothetical protein